MTKLEPPRAQIAALIQVLNSTRQYLALPQNDFTWSSWHSAEDALAEMDALIAQLEQGAIPLHSSVSILFAPTGPIQEVSLSSGWGDDFLKIAARFDEIEPRLWPADARR